MSNPIPFLNAALDVVIATTGDIAADLSTLRPLLRNAIFSAYATDKIENAPIATFPDGADNIPVKSATFGIDPQQDLHGYDAPWPAGGGKNILPMTVADIKAANTSGTWSGNAYTVNDVTFSVQTNETGAVTGVSVSGTASANVSFYIVRGADLKVTTEDLYVSGCPSGGTSSTYRIRASNGSTINEYGSGAQFLSGNSTIDLYIQIISGYAASNLLFKPMVSASSDLTFAPYSNICPISGWTGTEITAKGANLWNGLWDVGGINGTTGQNASDANAFRSRGYIPIKPNEEYFFFTNIEGLTGSAARVFFYKSDKTFISYWNVVSTPLFTAPVDAHYLRFKVSVAHQDTYQVGINNPSTDTSYHASVGATKDITWQDEAGTVYGGTIAYLGGDSWRLTKTMESVDLGTMDYGNTPVPSDGLVGTLSIQNTVKAPALNSQLANIICSAYQNSSRSNLLNIDSGISINTGGVVVFRDLSVVGLVGAQIASAVSGYILVYELATPVSYDLTSEELTTVLGNNNIFSNTGDVTELAYRADTALYIAKKLAE